MKQTKRVGWKRNRRSRHKSKTHPHHDIFFTATLLVLVGVASVLGIFSSVNNISNVESFFSENFITGAVIGLPVEDSDDVGVFAPGGNVTGWNHTFSSSGGMNDDIARAVARDSSDNVFVVGYAFNITGTCTGFNCDDWWVKKFNSTGGENITNWNRTFTSTGSNNDRAYGVAINSNNSIFVVGSGDSMVADTTGLDWWIKKFWKNGSEDLTWNITLTGPTSGGDDIPYAIAIDSLDNIYVAGSGDGMTGAAKGSDWWITKFNKTADHDVTNWNLSFSSALDSKADEALAIEVDSNDSIYVVGYGNNLTGDCIGTNCQDWWIKKFNTSGSENTSWNINYSTNEGSKEDYAYDVATDSARDVYVVGSGYNLSTDCGGNKCEDGWIKKFDLNGTEDTVNWNLNITSVGNKTDEFRSVVVDENDNIYIAGIGDNISGECNPAGNGCGDWWIKKFNTSGFENVTSWNISFAGGFPDKAYAMAVDSTNNISIVGDGSNLVTASSSLDWWVQKVEGDPIAPGVASVGCGTLTADTTMTENVTSTATCFNIGANHITLDCVGYMINYSTTSDGNAVNVTHYDNVTVKNCFITEGDDATSSDAGIYVGNSSNSTVQNNTIIRQSSSTYGVYTVNSLRTTVKDNNITGSASSADGIFIDTESNQTQIINNKVLTSSTDADGVYITEAGNVNLSHNHLNVSGLRANGIYLIDAPHNILLNNSITAFSSAGEGLEIKNSNYVNLTNNTISTVKDFNDAIYILTSANLTLRNNTLIASSGFPIKVDGNTNADDYNHDVDSTNLASGLSISYNYSLQHNVTEDQNLTSTYGFLVCASCENVTYRNVNISGHGLALFGTDNSLIEDSYINVSDGYAIGLVESSTNTINNNTLQTNFSDSYGVYLGETSWTNLVDNNTIITQGGNAFGVEIDVSSNEANITNNNITTLGSGADAVRLDKGDDHWIAWNNITTSGSGSGVSSQSGVDRNFVFSNHFFVNNHGVDMDASDSNFVSNNTINVIGSNNYAISLSSSSRNNIIHNNNMSSVASHTIWDTTGTGNLNYLVYNTSDTDLRWVDNGTGSFVQDMDLDGAIGFGLNLEIGRGYVALNTTNFTTGVINGSANITMRSLTYDSITEIKKVNNFTAVAADIIYSGTDCVGVTCNITGYSGGVLTFNTSSFSSFAGNGTPDATEPTIGVAELNKTAIIQNESVKLNVSVTDNDAVDTVYFGFVDMGNLTPIKSGDEYYIVCNATTSGCNTTDFKSTNWTSVWANDSTNNENTTTPDLNFTVNEVDLVAPTLGVETLQDDFVKINGATDLVVTVTDNIGVETVYFGVDGVGNVTPTKSGTTYTFSCNATNACNTSSEKLVTWSSIWANDSSNNTNITAVSHTFNVSQASACGNVSGYVRLNDNVSSAGTCFHVNASHTRLNCRGYNITYATGGSGNGLNVTNYVNVSVEHCDIYTGNSGGDDYKHGIYYNGTINGTIDNNTINSIGGISSAIELQSTNRIIVSNNSITTSATGAHGIVLNTAGNNTVILNKLNVTSGTSEGIQLSSSSHNNIITGNLLNISGGDPGITLTDSNNTNITNNTIYTDIRDGYPIQIATSSLANISGNSLNNTKSIAIAITGTLDTDYNHTIDETNTADGLAIAYNKSVDNQVLYENQDLSTTFGQLICGGCENVTYHDITMYTDGIGLFNTSRSTISYSTLNSTNGHGITLLGNSDDNTLRNNNLSVEEGLEIWDVTSNARINHLIYNNSFGIIRWVNTSAGGGLAADLDLTAPIGINKNLFIGNNTIALNTSNFVDDLTINGSANLTLYLAGNSITSVGQIFKYDQFNTNATDIQYNGTDCSGSSCYEISYDSGTGVLEFNSTSFSSFSVNSTGDVAPTVTLNTPVNSTNTSSTSVTFNCSVTDDVAIENVTLYGDWSGVWQPNETQGMNGTSNSTTFTKTIPEGDHLWNCEAFDSLAQSVVQADNFSITVDETVPQIEYTAQTAINATNTTQTEINVTVTVTETNEANITFTLYNATDEVNNTINFTSLRSLNFTGLPDATYEYNVTIYDFAGNSNTTPTRQLTIDTTVPQIELGQLTETNSTFFNRTWIYFNVTVNETNEANITFTLHNTTNEVNSTTYTSAVRTINITDLPDGTYNYNVTVYDTAGNSNTTFTRQITLDSILPAVIIVLPTNTTYTNNVSIELNHSSIDANINSTWYTLDGGANTSFTQNTTFDVATEVSHTIILYVNDSAGNVNSSNVTFTYRKSPNITIKTPIQATNLSNLELPVNVSIDETGTIWRNIDNNGNVTLCYGCTHANVTVNLTDFGNHSIIIYANDTSNNVNSTTFNFNVSIDTDGDGVADEVDTDDDSDGLADDQDVIVGNFTNVNARNFNSINFTVNNSINITHNFSGLNTVNFTNGTHRFVEFFYNFTANQSLVLANVTITKQNRTDTVGSLIVRGLNMTEGQTKTIYVDDLDADKSSICIKDAEIAVISEISSDCDETNETKLACSAAGTTTGKYTCTDVGEQYKIDGVTHSGALEVTATATSSSSSSSSGGSGSGGGDTGGFAIPQEDELVDPLSPAEQKLGDEDGNQSEEDSAQEEGQAEAGDELNGPLPFIQGLAILQDAGKFVVAHKGSLAGAFAFLVLVSVLIVFVHGVQVRRKALPPIAYGKEKKEIFYQEQPRPHRWFKRVHPQLRKELDYIHQQLASMEKAAEEVVKPIISQKVETPNSTELKLQADLRRVEQKLQGYTQPTTIEAPEPNSRLQEQFENVEAELSSLGAETPSQGKPVVITKLADETPRPAMPIVRNLEALEPKRGRRKDYNKELAALDEELERLNN